MENVLAGETLARVQAAWDEWEAPSKAAWLDAREHNSGIARHSFTGSEEGHPVVTRKFFGFTAAKPFLQLDPSFIDLVHNDASPGSDSHGR